MLKTSSTSRFQGTPTRLSVFGAAPDTGNLGVSALCLSLLDGLTERAGELDFTVFDHGRGSRAWSPPSGPRALNARRIGAVHSRRVHRPESWWRMWAAASWGLGTNAGVERVRASNAVLDVSGGDSFSDIYGPKRFRAVTMPKQLALELGRPLVLLPQTYGPFRSDDARRTAEEIVRGSTAAWARDERSYTALQDLLGDRFDPERHRCTVDMAFGLRAQEPADQLADPIGAWLEDPSAPIIGINISGLLANRASDAADRFALRADYREVVSRLTCEVLATTDARVVLVPHVHAPIGHPESDLEASLEVMRRVPQANRARVAVLPTGLGAAETKWFIGKLDWLCATRMHACIAGLSSGVPVAGIAYSDKAAGVFESCGQGQELTDPRARGTEAVLDALLDSCRRRDVTKQSMATPIRRVLESNAAFFDDLATHLGMPDGATRLGAAA